MKQNSRGQNVLLRCGRCINLWMRLKNKCKTIVKKENGTKLLEQIKMKSSAK